MIRFSNVLLSVFVLFIIGSFLGFIGAPELLGGVSVIEKETNTSNRYTLVSLEKVGGDSFSLPGYKYCRKENLEVTCHEAVEVKGWNTPGSNDTFEVKIFETSTVKPFVKITTRIQTLSWWNGYWKKPDNYWLHEFYVPEGFTNNGVKWSEK
jgi:hypothetical protein